MEGREEGRKKGRKEGRKEGSFCNSIIIFNYINVLLITAI